jgi:hypothetical protein
MRTSHEENLLFLSIDMPSHSYLRIRLMSPGAVFEPDSTSTSSSSLCSLDEPLVFNLTDPDNVAPLFGFGGNAGMPIGPTAELSGFGVHTDSVT